jgi:glycerol-3-phosphate acyltransferase PlsY
MMDPVSAGALGAVAGYLCGSIPFGLILTQAAGLGDVRRIGSGSIGATNVLRTGNKVLAAATLVLDAAKGTAAVLLAPLLFGAMAPDTAALAAALGAVVGHMYPAWLGFRGGKGVATALGALVALAWPVALALAAVWLAMAALFRISSLASLTASAAAPFLAFLLAGPRMAAVVLAVAVLIVWRHRENIARLLAGTEPRIGVGK